MSAVPPPSAASAPVDPALVARRDALVERFAVLQSELGGLFYEMAIRDHVRMDVLIERAATLQGVDTELGQVEALIAGGAPPAGHCANCGIPHARGAAFCAGCGQPLTD